MTPVQHGHCLQLSLLRECQSALRLLTCRIPCLLLLSKYWMRCLSRLTQHLMTCLSEGLERHAPWQHRL